jgi:glycosyltransferase involved in cell wall biosynthesis
MKVLWIINSPFPEIAEMVNVKDFAKSWILSSAKIIVKQFPNIQLGIASFYNGKKIFIIKKNKISHYLIPQKVRSKGNSNYYDKYWVYIKNEFNPDIVHIHGSEYIYSYMYVRACGAENVVVSIQGLVSIIERYYFAGIKNTELIKNLTIGDLIRKNSIFAQYNNLRKRGSFEKLLIKAVSHVIGRTTWDNNHVLNMNPNINYHFCNETLRPSFYKKKWTLENCQKYSIFISQAYYPLKGFHQLIKALPFVLKYFPQTKVYVAGTNHFTNYRSLKTGFGQYIHSMINSYYLNDKINFVGILSEEEMSNKYCQSHVFISPSAIENSSNSIGEAQILGVPCIASYVGGTPDMIEHMKTGLLYRFEEVEMLAANICRLFSDNQLAYTISENSKLIAAQRHNALKNANDLIDIYLKINSSLNNL